jgi:hypothetical protein
VFDDATHSISATKIRKEMGIEWYFIPKHGKDA